MEGKSRTRKNKRTRVVAISIGKSVKENKGGREKSTSGGRQDNKNCANNKGPEKGLCKK